MSDKKEYIERGALIDELKAKIMTNYLNIFDEVTLESVIRCAERQRAADVEPVVRCAKCKYGTPLKRNADGVYGLHCTIGRGEEVRNVWHKYSKHYEDYSLVDVDGFCDQGEAGQPDMERSGSGE